MRYAICNETFEGWEHERVCRFVAELGYTGLELAPFTLAPRITEVSAAQRTLLRRQADEHGISIIGLHWLLARTEGLQLTSDDPAVRQRTANYLMELARCCRDLGGDLLVFGSPAQRRIPPGLTREQATEFAVDTIRQALPALADCDVRLCLEPLTPLETDFINTCAEAAVILDQFDHRNIALHLDVKAMASESIPTTELIRRYASQTAHFHANDPNKRGPGFGATDFVPIFQALRASNYQGWVSVEVFDYSPDPQTIARDSLRYMQQCAAKAGCGTGTAS
jgi:sugar phosphate isomerase/epimerase